MDCLLIVQFRINTINSHGIQKKNGTQRKGEREKRVPIDLCPNVEWWFADIWATYLIPRGSHDRHFLF